MGELIGSVGKRVLSVIGKSISHFKTIEKLGAGGMPSSMKKYDELVRRSRPSKIKIE